MKINLKKKYCQTEWNWDGSIIRDAYTMHILNNLDRKFKISINLKIRKQFWGKIFLYVKIKWMEIN